MDHKQLMLHELLQQDQEPFHLKSYISDKRSHLHNSSPPPPTHLKRRAFLHVPSRTAAVLAEAAVKIQKQRRQRSQIKSVGLCLFDSFFKALKFRSKNRALRNCDLKNSEVIGISCSCKRLSRDDLRASTSTDHRPELFHEVGDFELREARFCSSPFGFCLHKSPSSPAATSPIRRVKQEKENSTNVSGGEELEEKEQNSPVSVLDTFFEEEEDDEDDDVNDLKRSYANIERARVQLLDRLRRFEKLAALDLLDLEQKLLEASDEECQKGEDDDDDIKRCSSTSSSTPMKRQLVCDDHVVLGGTWRHLLRAADPIEVVMVELDFKAADFDESEEEETAVQIELAIFGGLIQELSDELFCINV